MLFLIAESQVLSQNDRSSAFSFDCLWGESTGRASVIWIILNFQRSLVSYGSRLPYRAIRKARFVEPAGPQVGG